jgi:hypothetical protein
VTDPIQDYIDEVDAQDEGEQAPPAEEPAPEPEAEEVPEEAAEEEELIAGRFKSTEDLAKSYLSLEEKFKERDDEIGELRKFREQQEWQRDQDGQASQSVPLSQETVDWFDDQAMENPYGAAQWALQNDPTGALYNRAIDMWYEQNPRQASAFERQTEMAMLAQAMDQRYGQAIQPLTDNAAKQDFVDAWQQAAGRIPDINNVSDKIVEVARQSPEVLRALEQGTPESKQQVIQNLYYMVKGMQADTAETKEAGAQAAQAAETTQAKRDASFVARPGQRPQETNTNVERWLSEVFDPAAQQYYGE